MTVQDFINQHNGGRLDVDGYPSWQPYQCTDLAETWCDVNDWPRLPGDAVEFFGERSDFYDSIPNSPDGVPQGGDIVIWQQDAIIGTGPAGHVAVATGEGNTDWFNSFDQNWPSGSACYVRWHSYEGLVGWLRPKNQPSNQGGEFMSRSEQSYIDEINQLLHGPRDGMSVDELTNANYVRGVELDGVKEQVADLQSKVDKLTKTNTDQQAEIERLKKLPQGSTDSKFETLKALLRELFNIK